MGTSWWNELATRNSLGGVFACSNGDYSQARVTTPFQAPSHCFSLVWLPLHAPAVRFDLPGLSGPIRLAGSEMSTSRGKTLANNFGSCNALSKFNACAANNNPCNTCGPTSAGQQYAFAGGQGRQVDPGVAGAGNCNNIYNGTCNLANGILFCNTSAPGGGDTTNPCTAPPGVPPQEPQ